MVNIWVRVGSGLWLALGSCVGSGLRLRLVRCCGKRNVMVMVWIGIRVM